MLEGEAVMEVEGVEFVLRPGQSLAVPAQAAHQFFNRSDADVRFLVISQPTTHGDRQAA